MNASVVFNRSISPGYRHLGIAVPGFPAGVRAGQFVMVRPPWVGDPFLPRAFSIYRLSLGAEAVPVIEILYKIVGKGTRYFATLEPGQDLELLGPLGNSFTPPPTGGIAVLVAGGIGVPPISALAAEMINAWESVTDPATGRGIWDIHVFLGGKTAEDILCAADFEALGIRPRITTEDGGLGVKGLITDLLGPFLQSAALHSRLSALILYTCGPPGMLAAVAQLAEEYGVPCQVSVEANMACGFGACMGCAIEVRSSGPGREYKLACKDGPVFDAREIVWG